jgi:hypothetical protein
MHKDEIIDPGKLFNWSGGIHFHIKSEDDTGGKYSISGYVTGLISSLPDPKPELTFDFTLERVE